MGAAALSALGSGAGASAAGSGAASAGAGAAGGAGASSGMMGMLGSSMGSSPLGMGMDMMKPQPHSNFNPILAALGSQQPTQMPQIQQQDSGSGFYDMFLKALKDSKSQGGN